MKNLCLKIGKDIAKYWQLYLFVIVLVILVLIIDSVSSGIMLFVPK